MVFAGVKVAVFVDGCFWHGCPLHYSAPATNPEYWTEKVRSNCERDVETDRSRPGKWCTSCHRVIRFCRLSGEGVWELFLVRCVAGDYP
ncbi:hypothetical protein Mame01_53630 [Microbispora amethystogenes]|nr:hypothetical protein Mame01_53630 [Microbispora amethystogenes]